MISVCIATYNGEKFIRQQLYSILPQLSATDEIVISDDGSTDRTLEIISSIHSPLIRIYHNEEVHGYTPNFENALKHTKGDYIFLSDQDDLWKPQKVAVCLEKLKTYDFVISDADLVDGDNQKIGESFYHVRRSKSGLLNNLLRFSYLGCCMAFRKRILERALPFPSQHTLCTHDNWLALMGMMYYRTIVIPDALISYRRHCSNASSGGLQATTSLFFKIRYRFYLIYNLLRRR